MGDRTQQELNHSMRVGVVTSRDPERMTVRVQVRDQDDFTSYDLPVVVRKTKDDKDYCLPDVGEHVVCLFQSYGQEQGFCLGAFFSDADTTPVQSGDKRHVKFKDGTWIEYDRENHLLEAHVEGDIRIEATGNITIIGQRIDLNPEG